MKKRALCLFLALALCLSLLPASAFAANGSKAIMLGSDILSEGGEMCIRDRDEGIRLPCRRESAE